MCGRMEGKYSFWRNAAQLLRVVVVLALSLPLSGSAQYDCVVVPHMAPQMQDCSPSSTAWHNTYREQSSYAVGEPLNPGATKAIKIAVHIWQDDNGGNQWPESPAVVNLIEEAIADLDGGMWTYNDEPSDVVPGVAYLPDTKLRVDFQGVFFHQNSAMNSILLSGPTWQLSAQAINEDPAMAEYLLLHFVCPTCHYCCDQFGNPITGIAGVSNGSVFGSFGTNHYVVTKGGWGLDSDWQLAQHWAHEIGHNLELCHTYGPQCGETCVTTDVDFLSDVFYPLGTAGNKVVGAVMSGNPATAARTT